VSVSYSPEVRCGGCSRLRERSTCRAVEGVLYGPECYESARSGDLWDCGVCRFRFPADLMADATICNGCAEAT
jgi:hypothetical protein